ncbi:lysozyme inhibitor LprI family protein [Flavobacteriaceae bacterium M23B6Z8]
MILRSIYFIAFLSFTTVQIGYGQEIALISKSYQTCIDQNVPTTDAAMQCAQKAIVKYELLLNEKLYQLKELVTQDTISLIELNQEAWKKWEKAEIDFYSSCYQELYKGGTLGKTAILNKRMDLLKNRIEDLEDKIELFKE